MKTINAKLSNGERFPLLIDDSGIPDLWVATYVLVKCRTNHDFNTMKNIVCRLRSFRYFEIIFGRNIEAEFARGEFLSESDCEKLRSFSWINQSTLNVDKENGEISTLFSGVRHVSAEVSAQRLRDIRKFLIFLAETINKSTIHRNSIRQSIKNMDKNLGAIIPRTNPSRNSVDPSQKAPAPEIFLKIMELADPDNPRIPFRKVVRIRNSLMFKILFSTGMRLGELLCLRTDSEHLDLAAEPPMIHIRKPSSRENHVDERYLPPSQKTVERSIIISSELASEIDEYIMVQRRRVLPARKHGWLFVNHRRGDHWGSPVSINNWINSVDRLRKVDPDLYHGVKSHGFRHTFAFLWNEKVDRHNAIAAARPELKMKIINEKERQDAFMDIMGWTSINSAKPYELRRIKKIVDSVTLEGVRDLSKYIDISTIGGD
jgi:integrase